MGPQPVVMLVGTEVSLSLPRSVISQDTQTAQARKKATTLTQALDLLAEEGLTKHTQWLRIKVSKLVKLTTSRIFLRLELPRPRSVFTHPHLWLTFFLGTLKRCEEENRSPTMAGQLL